MPTKNRLNRLSKQQSSAAANKPGQQKISFAQSLSPIQNVHTASVAGGNERESDDQCCSSIYHNNDKTDDYDNIPNDTYDIPNQDQDSDIEGHLENDDNEDDSFVGLQDDYDTQIRHENTEEEKDSDGGNVCRIDNVPDNDISDTSDTSNTNEENVTTLISKPVHPGEEFKFKTTVNKKGVSRSCSSQYF